MSDEELVRRTLEGDTGSFAELVERYRDAAYGVGLHVLGEPVEAATVAQDAFVRAWRALDQLREPAKFPAWLCRIARNLALRRLSIGRAAAGVVSLEELEEMPAQSNPPDDCAQQSEVAAIVKRLVEALPDEQRLAFTLFYVDGYSYGDLSRMLDLPEGTVKSQLARARARLKRGFVEMAKDTLQQEKPDAEFWRSATGTMSGCVTSAESGEPIADAFVALSDVQMDRSTCVKSQPDGTWKASSLLPGTYSVTAGHRDWVAQTYPSRPSGKSHQTSAVVRPGQTVRGIDFQLTPAAKLRGVVLAGGVPVPKAVVTLFRTREHRGLAFPPAHQDPADDEGRFDIEDVVPGEYLITARRPPEPPGYVPPATLYPGTFSTADAARVRLSAGAPGTELTIELAERGTAALHVHVADAETDEPIPDAGMHVIRRDMLFYGFKSLTDEAGVFRTDAVGPGPFQVIASAPDRGYARWTKWVDITSEGETGELAFRLVKGAVLAGAVCTEDGSELPPLPRFEAWAATTAPETIEGHARGNAKFRAPSFALAEGPQEERIEPDEDGRFVSPPVTPGKVSLRAETNDPAWRVVSFLVGDRALRTGDKVDCVPGERTSDVRIVIGTSLGIVAGRVVAEASGEPVPNAHVSLSRRDREVFWTPPIETDRAGSFIFHSVRAGAYEIGIAPTDDGPTAGGTTREVRVAPGEVVHLDLVLPKE